mmetsp:Transcript_10756/g.21237  ORF Transcript_10756/g.21237 Transcript_10756/m.21237 type:complete len:260 (+) Transcript_10756:132-911(+)
MKLLRVARRRYYLHCLLLIIVIGVEADVIVFFLLLLLLLLCLTLTTLATSSASAGTTTSARGASRVFDYLGNILAFENLSEHFRPVRSNEVDLSSGKNLVNAILCYLSFAIRKNHTGVHHNHLLLFRIVFEEGLRSLLFFFLRRLGISRSGSLRRSGIIIVVVIVVRPTAQPKDKVEGGLFLDVVICKGAAILKLLSRKNQALLIRGDSFLILNLLLHGVDGVRRINIECDSFSREGLNEDLHRHGKLHCHLQLGVRRP